MFLLVLLHQLQHLLPNHLLFLDPSKKMLRHLLPFNHLSPYQLCLSTSGSLASTILWEHQCRSNKSTTPHHLKPKAKSHKLYKFQKESNSSKKK